MSVITPMHPPEPGTFFGPALSGQKQVKAKDLPTRVVAPTHTPNRDENDLKHNNFNDSVRGGQPQSSNSTVTSLASSPFVSQMVGQELKEQKLLNDDFDVAVRAFSASNNLVEEDDSSEKNNENGVTLLV